MSQKSEWVGRFVFGALIGAAGIFPGRAAAALPAVSGLARDPGVASGIRLLEAWIEARMAYEGLPGLSIAIVHDQNVVWSRGFGYADREKKTPATPDTIYRIASITKTFTATALMILRDEGRLQLDDPVAKHLPWFRVDNKFPDAPVITIRHLLTHTSGLPRESVGPYWVEFAFPTREEMIAALPRQPTPLPSEGHIKYSNLALALTGEIVAAASGEPYEKFVQDRILTPLGMAGTSVTLTPEHRARLAVAYGRRMPDGTRALMPFTETKGIAPAANISSTAADLAHYAMLQMREGRRGGEQILKASTLREMHRVQWLESDWKNAWGLGFAVWRQGERTVFGHGGAVAGYRTQIAISPEEKIGVIVMTNTDDGRPGRFVAKAFEWVAPAITKAVAPEKEPGRTPKEWANYVGVYRSLWGDVQVMVHEGSLVMFDPTSDSPRDEMYRLTPEGPRTFRQSICDGEGGELVVFEPGPDSRAARMKDGDNYSVRVEY